MSDLYLPYVESVLREIATRAHQWQAVIFDSVYFGGGTPTVLPSSQLVRILQALDQHLRLTQNPEVTVEANPGTVDKSSLVTLCRGGVNRLSLGVQSLDEDELALLGRIHSPREAVEAYRLALESGFENINLDLIFGLPGQTVAQWERTLRRAVCWRPAHLSLYALTIEDDTPLGRQVSKGVLPMPDDDIVAEMYELAEAYLAAEGYEHYEISNWAREPRFVCRHNLHYWRNERYLGLGAAAWSYDGTRRYGNIEFPRAYIARLRDQVSPEKEGEVTDEGRRMDETMMLGLRLIRGISWRAFQERFHQDARRIYAAQIRRLLADGLVHADAEGLRLTARGRLLGNRVFSAFLREA